MNEFNLENYLLQLSSATNIDDCPKVPIPAIENNQNYLFISYSHRDYKMVYEDLAHLYGRGVRFWYDKGLSAGKDWEKEVEAHIKDPHCCGVIFYISTNMFLSSSVLKEIEFTRTRKRNNHILQKNYFCVNLHNGNISAMLLEAQLMKQRDGLPLLDTTTQSTLTGTFSDNATYIKYNSRDHVNELVDQIQRQFDVTNTPAAEVAAKHGLETIRDTRTAVRAFFGKETALIPLCKYLRKAYRDTKATRDWWLIPIAVCLGLLGAAYGVYMMITAPTMPYMEALKEQVGAEVLAVMIGFGGCICVPYTVLKVFWLYYLSPVYEKNKKSKMNRLLNAFVFLSASAIAGVFWTAWMLVLAMLVLNGLEFIEMMEAGMSTNT